MINIYALLSGLAFLASNTIYHVGPLFRQHLTMVRFETLAVVVIAHARIDRSNAMDEVDDVIGSRQSFRRRVRRIEMAKHRLFYSLIKLKLPLADRAHDPAHGLAFDFLADPIGSNRTPVSDEITVQPGDQVRLVLPPR